MLPKEQKQWEKNMPMPVLVRGYLKEVYVLYNGDVDFEKERDKRNKEIKKKEDELEAISISMDDGTASVPEIQNANRLANQIEELKLEKTNALIVTLAHPGEDGNIKIIRENIGIGNGRSQRTNFDSTDFLENGLFKKLVYGEFGIAVAITDTDEKNPFLLFLRRVLSGVFSAVTKSPVGDISNVLTANAASELSSDIQKALKGKSDDKVTIVAKSDRADFKIDNNGKLVLMNPSDGITYNSPKGKLTLKMTIPRFLKKGKKTYAKMGAKNGHVVLQLVATSMD